MNAFTVGTDYFTQPHPARPVPARKFLCGHSGNPTPAIHSASALSLFPR